MKSQTVFDLTLMALLTALLCVSSYLIIPLPFTPALITAQTLVVNLIALLLIPRQCAFVLGTWILIGTIGLPVFSGGSAGLGKLLGPSGGYIWGLLAASIFISLFKGKQISFYKYFITTLIGIPIVYFFGTGWMKLQSNLDWQNLFTASILPFLPLDILKCGLAAYLAPPLSKLLLGFKGGRS